MNTNKLHTVLHLALLTALVVFSGASCSASKSQSEPTPESDYAEMKTKAAEDFPNELPSVALHNSSQKTIGDQFSAETDPDKRATKAADMFMGFYNMTTRAFSEYCGEYNVDLQPFVSAFKARHVKEHQKAISIRKSTPEFEYGQYSVIRTQLRGMAEQQMKDIASVNKTTIAGACELMASNADYLSAEMHISKLQPLVYAELTYAK